MGEEWVVLYEFVRYNTSYMDLNDVLNCWIFLKINEMGQSHQLQISIC